MNVIFSSVSSALGDPQSLLSKAVGAALKVGVGRMSKAQSNTLAKGEVSKKEAKVDA